MSSESKNFGKRKEAQLENDENGEPNVVYINDFVTPKLKINRTVPNTQQTYSSKPRHAATTTNKGARNTYKLGSVKNVKPVLMTTGSKQPTFSRNKALMSSANSVGNQSRPLVKVRLSVANKGVKKQ